MFLLMCVSLNYYNNPRNPILSFFCEISHEFFYQKNINYKYRTKPSSTIVHKQCNLCAFITDKVMAAWSRGMIPPSGGGGLGFDSPSGPFFLLHVGVGRLSLIT